MSRHYALVIDKRPDCTVVFSVCASQTEALRAVSNLAAVGLSARAGPAFHGDIPGVQRRAQQRTSAHASG